MDNALPQRTDGPSPAEIQGATAFGRFVNAIANGSAVLSGISVVAILLIVCIEVGLRQFNKSLLVADEICGYLNAAAVFLGLAYTLRDGGFIRVELLYDRLKGAVKQAVRWFIVITGTVYVAALLYFTIIHVSYLYKQDVRAISIIDTPEWIPQTFAVIGLAALLLQLAAFIVNRVRNVP
jgi:TRAP-type C4-dicarboxylate transport system permease small subunit